MWYMDVPPFQLFEKYGITESELPKIHKADPAIRDMDLEVGEVVKVKRGSPTSGSIEYYRCVIE